MSAVRDLRTDCAWDNRRLILASLAPRAQTRPARRGLAEPVDQPGESDKAGILASSMRACERLARTGGRRLRNRVPPERRLHTVITTVAAVVILLAALSAVRYLTTDIRSQSPTAATPPAQTVAPQAPMSNDTILTSVKATDACPKDGNHSGADRAFDGDINTAWVCTRAKNKDGQVLEVSFGRQVTLTQIRVIGGFDASAPDGTDEWSQHRICTELEVWFPKDLKRDPLTIDTGGVRDWRPVTVTPAATVTKLVIRVKETSDPPQPATAPTESAAPGADSTTTVAISEIQFIGTDDRPHTT